MAGPSLRLQAACPCCGQALRPSWRIEPRWGRYVEFGGPGKITPVGVVHLDAPPALVQQAAWVASWATPPGTIVGHVYAAASALAAAGWTPVVQEPVAPAMPPATSAPWPPPWPR